MEVDCRPLDEHKEGDIALLLHAIEHDDGGSTDFSLQPPHGQMQISRLAYSLLPLNPTYSDSPVSVVYCHLGAPLVLRGLSQPVDPTGKPKCALCPTRLSRCKGKLYKHSQGQICQRCYDGTRRESRAPSPPPTPSRSNKRKQIDQGKPQIAPAVLIAPPLPPPTPQPSFHTHGSSLHPSSRTSRATAVSWLELAFDNELDRWEKKRGGYFQYDTAQSLKRSFMDEKRVRLRHSAERIARTQLSALGIETTSLHLWAFTSPSSCVSATSVCGTERIHRGTVKFTFLLEPHPHMAHNNAGKQRWLSC
jgi:hypothetical protein